ncbi:hypothetical protein CKO25_00405 [Thiocapsa imhoffii]|uniref:GDT1 family protein n=1 Tax=Thiocapsa imhoffii TaxID=382777 RepID=A0A9X0WEK4_9GAMM|nr:TMEM165/GDT1 family protein [Thiocapsa imhoffii]MBK1643138.1 hypothetical protein [Thiocapsa imhoffii]
MPSLDLLTAIVSTFGLIFLAEIGDKSQLVCIALAARHRHVPVMLGAAVAFAILNTLAVVFGAALAQWIPERLLAAAVAILFGVFGLKALMNRDEDDDPDCTTSSKTGHGIFVTTLLMLLLAEMGDKTQLAVAALTVTFPPLAVWLGATLALITTSALGVWLGVRFLRRIPMRQVHRVSGIFFLALALFAAVRVF